MSNYVPYLSSSPPPLGSQESPDNDEDFGSFASASFPFNDEGAESPVKHTPAAQRIACSDHATPVNSTSASSTLNHISCNSIDVDNKWDGSDEHNNSAVSGATEMPTLSKSNVWKKSIENFNSKDSDIDFLPDANEGQSGTNVSVLETKLTNDWDTDACDNGSSCTDDWADFTAASPSFVGESSSLHLQQDNDVPLSWTNSAAEETSHRECVQEEILQTNGSNGSCADDKEEAFLGEHKNDDFTDFAGFSDLSAAEETTFRTDFETDVSGDTSVTTISNSELADKLTVCVKPSVADNVNSVDNNSTDDATGFQKEGSSVAAAEGGESDDEFTDFVRPSDDDTALVDEPVLPVPSWPPAAAAASGNGSLSSESLPKDFSRRESEETFQPPFVANFDDEFSTFTSAPVSSAPQEVSDASRLESVISTNFSEHSSSALDKCNIEPLDVISDSSECFQVNLWPYLCDFEKTNALTYHWSNSNSSKKLLKALNIDSRNLLFGHNWNSSIPIFAANLSFNPLEPIKTPWKPEERGGDLSVTESANQTVKSEEVRGIIPPAQFDWNSSGLTNPLDGSTQKIQVEPYAVEVFVGEAHRHGLPNFGLENELLGQVVDNEVDASSPSSKALPLLEQILSTAKFSASNLPTPKEHVELSTEAKTVISRLPDLNFMQAKVLMFPIRDVSP